jgi:hypothetical protein
MLNLQAERPITGDFPENRLETPKNRRYNPHLGRSGRMARNWKSR